MSSSARRTPDHAWLAGALGGALGAVLAIAAVLTGRALLLVFVAVAVPVGAFVWMRPQRGVLLLVALLPFDGLLLVAGLPDVVAGWKEVLLGLTVVAAFATSSEGGGRPVPRWAFPAGALFAVALISAATVGPLRAAVGLKILFFGMLTAVAVWRCPLDARDRDLLVTILAATAAIVAAVGLAQQVVGPQPLNELGYAYNATIRFTGDLMRSWSTFNQPFPFAFFLMLVVLVTGAVAMDDPLRTRNLLILIAMPLYLAGMAASVVRAAWIGVAVGVSYLAVVRYRRLFRVAPAVIGALAIALVLGVSAFFVPPSLAQRFERWQRLPSATAAAPFGQGVGSAGAAAAQVATLSGGEATFDPERAGSGTQVVFQPDNSYFKVLYELGIVGLGLFVALLLVALASTRAREADPELGAFATGASALVVAAAATSVASTFFEIFPLDYLFWLVVGVASVGVVRDRRSDDPTARSAP